MVINAAKFLDPCLNMPEWVITDARHDSTANAYHTTVPCLSGRCSPAVVRYVVLYIQVHVHEHVCDGPCSVLTSSTKKIVGISTISWTEHSVPQTREVACTKNVLPQVLARGTFS